MREKGSSVFFHASCTIHEPNNLYYWCGWKKNTTSAFKTLKDHYLYWGVTDFWRTSVCLFHCELEGKKGDGNEIDTGLSSGMKNATFLELNLSRQYHRDAIVPNMTAFVLEHYDKDIDFYHENVLPMFRARTAACGCVM